MSSYTPGSWEVHGEDSIVVKTHEKTKHIVAFATGLKVHPDSTRANARLIAAAPKLVNAANVSVAVIKLLAPNANLSDKESEIVDFVLNYLVTLLKQIDGVDTDFQLEINEIVRLLEEEAE